MPYKSKAQQRFMHARYPKMAKKWDKKTDFSRLREAGERLSGGKADGMDPDEFDDDELAKGIGDELEHTDDPLTAREISMDHLAGDSDYYSDQEACPHCGCRCQSGGQMPSLGALYVLGVDGEEGEEEPGYEDDEPADDIEGDDEGEGDDDEEESSP